MRRNNLRNLVNGGILSGKIPLISLVPWRPIIDRQLGREVMGIVQSGSVSWQLGRQRGISLYSVVDERSRSKPAMRLSSPKLNAASMPSVSNS